MTNLELRLTHSLPVIAGRMPAQPLWNAFIVLLIGMLNGYVSCSVPLLRLTNLDQDVATLTPIGFHPLNVLSVSLGFGLGAVLVWLVASFGFRLLARCAFSDSLRRSTAGFLVFLVPPLAGTTTIGGRSLFWLSFWAACFIFILSIKEVFADRMPGVIVPQNDRRWSARLLRPRIWLYLFLSGLYVSAVFGLFYPLEGPTGDEPNYLIIAHSLAMDGDLDLKNNYEQKDYGLFYSAHLHHRVTVDRSGRWLPSQGIGLPIALVPFYRAGVRYGQVVFLCRLFMTVCGLLCVYQLVQLFTVELELPLASLWGVLAVAGTSPFFIYTHQLYPEIPGALLLTLGCRYSLKSGRLFPVLGGIAAGLLPWLGIKFIIPLGAMMGVWFFGLIISFRSGGSMVDRYRGPFVRSFVTALLMLLIFFALFHVMYGTFDFVRTHGIKVENSDEQGGSGTLLWSLKYGFSHLPEALRIASGSLIDQRVGAFLYAPVYLLFLAGLLLSFSSGHRHIFSFLAVGITVGHWALFAWTGQWEGYCPPTRYLVPLGPFFAYWIGLVFLRLPKVGLRRFAHMLLFFSLVGGIFMMSHIHRFYHYVLWRNPAEKNHQLMILSSTLIDWTRVFPSMTVPDLAILPILIWSIGLVALTLMLLFSARKGQALSGKRYFVFSAALYVIVLFAMVVLMCRLSAYFEFFPSPTQAFHTFKRSETRQPIHIMTNDVYTPEQDGFWLRGRAGTKIVWELPEKGPQIFSLHSLTDNTVKVVVDGYKAEVQLERGKKTTFMLPSQESLVTNSDKPVINRSWRVMWLSCEHGLRPSDVSESTDHRFLGCFVQIPPSK